MEKSKIFILCLMFFYGCTSRVIVSTKNCKTKAVWDKTDPVEITDMGNEAILKDSFLEEQYDFVIRERVWTPLGQYSPETIDLKDALAEKGISCDQIKSVGVTFYNDYWDVLGSFIPVASSKSVLIYGKFEGYQ